MTETAEAIDKDFESTVKELQERYVLDRNAASRLFYKYRSLRWVDGAGVTVTHIGRLEQLSARVKAGKLPPVPIPRERNEE
jgi:hypothetical protein